MRLRGVVVVLSWNGWIQKQQQRSGWSTPNFRRRLLVWDAYKCHIREKTRSYLDKQTNTNASVIPGGLTNQLQPADVSWNKAFKTVYKDKYNEWMASREISYTAARNLRAPSKVLCLEWVREC